MAILKKSLLAIFISVAMFANVPAVMAAGKIEKATMAEVTLAVEEAISLSALTLAAIQNGEEEEESVLNLFQSTKQASKRIESNVVDRLRQKANGRLKKARSAYKKGDSAKAEELMTEVVQLFKDIETKRNAF